MGCPSACAGYELDANLDFDTDNSGNVGAGDDYPNWTPIGTFGAQYTAEFNGDGHTITNLTTSGAALAGLFGYLDGSSVIRDLGIITPSVSATTRAGGLAGLIGANVQVNASYVQGGSVALAAAGDVGGLIGRGQGWIRASYATASVDAGTHANSNVGGLIGANNGDIIASYAAGAVSATGNNRVVGGLLGRATGGASVITDSYCDTTVNGTSTPCAGQQAANTVTGKTTVELQSPTGYTGIYANWRIDIDGDTFPDQPWNFGTSSQYPALKTPSQRQADPVVDYDADGDNLIEIASQAQLNAVRYDLDGDGLPAAVGDYIAYAAAFPAGDLAATGTRMGCVSGCEGYELAADLTLSGDWTPIDGALAGYAAEFNGNGRTITGLTVPATFRAGLFGRLESGGAIRDLGIMAPNVSGSTYAGGLVGLNKPGAEITASYVQGGAITITIANGNGGGLVGRNQGDIKAAYARDVSVDGGGGGGFTAAGGLTGNNSTGGHIIASYAAEVSVSNAGMNVGRLTGLVFSTSSRITASYCDSTTSTACIGAYSGGASSSTLIALAAAYPAAELKSEVDYTGIYSDWNVSVDGDTFPDNPWSFGSTTTYPTLKTPAQRQAAAVMDYDADNDNLIDVDSLYQLNAIRHDLNGDGLPGAVGNYAAYAGAFPDGNISDTSTPYMGCPQTCAGYELTRNLDFDTDGQVGGVATSTDPYPNWPPIGGSYAATFDGNGRTISRLTITGNVRAGLFDTLTAAGVIRDVGIIAPSVRAAPPIGQYIGVLTASNGGTITASYVQGGSITVTNAYTYAGGLTGGNSGTIRASYATASVTKTDVNSNVGGLAGFSSGEIIASYAAGPVAGPGPATRVGAFVGTLSSPAAAITDSNCDTSVHTTPRPCVAVHISGANSAVTAAGYPAAQLQAPTGYTNMYRNWNLDLDGDTFPDYPWNFGTTTTYPTLYTPSERQTAAAQIVDYDLDDDNLIDITNLHQLNALRYDLDGNGLPDSAANYSAYTGGFPNGNISDTSTPYLGCQSTCIGYELTQNLDFAADRAAVTTTDAYPNWTPIPSYQSTLDGKGHTITRLTISGSHANAGLFAALTSNAVIRDLGIIAPNVTSAAPNANAGALVGNNAGLITASYIDQGSVTVTGANPYVGGLAGRNAGDLRAVWSGAAVTASTTATSTAGGLIGLHTGGLTASYAAGPVTGTSTAVGGLIGQIDTAGVTIVNSYCDITATTQSDCIGARGPNAPATVAAPGKTTAELQTPTDYTGIYEAWAITLTPNDATRYNVWNFGEPTDYPTLYQPADRQITITDTLPPPLPRTIPPEPEKPYNPAHDHPEIYNNPEYEMTATCQTHNPDENNNPQSATITFNLGTYTGPILLHLSIFTNQRYMAYETQDLALPTLDRNGQTATLRVETNPAQTRFRLDGRRNGLAANLLLGYANCQTNDP